MTGTKPIIVMKYGGVSLATAASVGRIVSELAKRRDSVSPVLVLSAADKTTRQLLTCAREAAEGAAGCFEPLLQSIFARHRELAAAFPPAGEIAAGTPLLDLYYEDLSRIMHGLSEIGELSPRLQDQILSYGELISTGVMSAVLTACGIRNRLLNAQDLIITDDTHSAAVPITDISYPRIRDAVTAALGEGDVPVIQGFIGSTRDGTPTTLGFEGSDYTAALVAEACSASALEVWKNVDGIMSADPDICPAAEIIPVLHYDRAALLSRLGARVLHPKTLAPVRNSSIPMRVKSLDSPAASGTMIGAEASRGKERVMAVTHRTHVSLLRLGIGEGIAPEAAVRAVGEWLEHAHLAPLYMSTDGITVLAAADTETALLPHRYALDHIGTAEAVDPIGTVSIIGDGLMHAGILARLFQALPCSRIYFVFQDAHSESVTIGVERSDVEKTVIALHDALVTENRSTA
ncbi:aspartate kinase [bacterium]|nr:aspartate kinase [bacterium]